MDVIRPEDYLSMSVTLAGVTKCPREKQIKNLSDVNPASASSRNFDEFRPAQLTRTRTSSNYTSNIMDISDILGSQPTKLCRFTNKPDHYHVNDIEGTMVRIPHFQTNRSVNPLCPEYKLPSFDEPEPFIPKFVRDSYNCADIAGTRAGTLYPNIAPHHDQLDVSDIPTRNFRHKIENKDIMSVEDINSNGGKGKNKNFRTSRSTNSMGPTYNIYGQVIQDGSQHSQDFEFIHKNRAEPLQKAAFEPGAKKGNYYGNKREINDVGDIIGATADSVHHAIQTNRETNPCNPTYKSLDGYELAPPVVGRVRVLPNKEQCAVKPTIVLLDEKPRVTETVSELNGNEKPRKIQEINPVMECNGGTSELDNSLTFNDTRFKTFVDYGKDTLVSHSAVEEINSRVGQAIQGGTSKFGGSSIISETSTLNMQYSKRLQTNKQKQTKTKEMTKNMSTRSEEARIVRSLPSY